MSLPSTAAAASTTIGEKEQQKIVDGFQKLREQQQMTINEMAKMQTEHREHETVLKTIKSLDPDRKCFRQVGDTLFEFKTAELATILEENSKKFKERMEELESEVVKIGEQINTYKAKHNIRLLSTKEAMELQKKQTLAQISKMELNPPTKSAKT